MPFTLLATHLPNCLSAAKYVPSPGRHLERLNNIFPQYPKRRLTGASPKIHLSTAKNYQPKHVPLGQQPCSNLKKFIEDIVVSLSSTCNLGLD